MYQIRWLIALTLLVAASAWCSSGDTRKAVLIDGVENVEDLVAIPDSPWIIGSGIGNWAFRSGGLHLVNAQTNKAYRVYLDFYDGLKPHAPYTDCAGPPDAELFSAHGLSLLPLGEQSFRLYAVNHGDRSAIEVFDVSSSDAEPSIRWVGCIPCPEGTFPNGVAALTDGGVVMSSTYNASGFWDRLWDNKGAVFIWRPGHSWREVPNSALPQNNGIVLSQDEQWAFVVSMPDRSVTYMPLEPGLGSSVRIPLDFYPDNIRRSFDDKLVVAGAEHVGLTRVNLCVLFNYPHCKIDFRADLIDPQTLAVSPLYSAAGSYDFGLATAALLTPDALWFGSVRSQHMLKVTFE